MRDILIIICVVSLISASDAKTDTNKTESPYCRVSTLRKDPKNFPLCLNSTTIDYLFYPTVTDSESIIVEQKSSELRVTCPRGFLKIKDKVLNQSSATLTCIDGPSFEFDGSPKDIVSFHDITCDRPVPHNLVQQTINCTSDFCYLCVTFITGLPFEFKDYYTLQFSKDMTNQHAAAWILPLDKRQQPVEPLTMMKGPYYEKLPTSVEKLFTYEFQKREFQDMFKKNETLVNRYINETNFIVREKMVSEIWFHYLHEQNSTFYLENTFPMYKCIKQNWDLIDVNIKKIVVDEGIPVILQVGGLGNLALQDASGRKTKIVIADKDPMQLKPAAFMYKLVYDPIHMKGVAFIIANDCFHDKITQDMHVCSPQDHCHKMFPQFADPSKGYTYCCDAKEFHQKVLKGKPLILA